MAAGHDEQFSPRPRTTRAGIARPSGSDPELWAVARQLDALDHKERAFFTSAYDARRRSTWSMELAAFLFPIQLFLLDETELGVVFWITGGGLLVWWVLEWFRTPRRVREYNLAVALELLDLLELLRRGQGAPER